MRNRVLGFGKMDVMDIEVTIVLIYLLCLRTWC